MLKRWPTLALYVTVVAFFARRTVGMGDWTFWDWIGYCGLGIAAILIAVDTAIAQSEQLRGHFSRPLKGYLGFLPLLSLLIGSGAFGYQQVHPTTRMELPPEAETGSPFGVIQAWGIDNGVFYTIIKTSALTKYRGLNRVVFIIRPNFSDVDQMTDTNIRKSQAYTILDSFMTLAIPLVGAPMKVAVDRLTPLQYFVVRLPAMFSPDQINSLSDVERLGGEILAEAGTAAQLLQTTNPQAVCPPTPAPPASPGKS